MEFIKQRKEIAGNTNSTFSDFIVTFVISITREEYQQYKDHF